MAILTDLQIEDKLKSIENKIKSKNDFTREDIQNSLNAIWGNGFSVERKKEILTAMIKRSGVKIEGAFYQPRIRSYGYGDKTYSFLSDIESYRGVRER